MEGAGQKAVFWFKTLATQCSSLGEATPPLWALKLIPALAHRIYPQLTSSPRGSHPEVCRWRGGGGACGWGYDPLPGGFGAPPWGHYDPCARSSLEGSGYPGPDAERVTGR